MATEKENEPATEEEFGSMEENVGGYRTRSRSGSNKRQPESVKKRKLSPLPETGRVSNLFKESNSIGKSTEKKK